MSGAQVKFGESKKSRKTNAGKITMDERLFRWESMEDINRKLVRTKSDSGMESRRLLLSFNSNFGKGKGEGSILGGLGNLLDGDGF